MAAGCLCLALGGCVTSGNGSATTGAAGKTLHTFYYGWYGNPAVDGNWVHWDHQIFLKEGGGGRHYPPEDIGASFYPADGLYSSNSPEDVAREMAQMKAAGIDVAVATWWGQGDYTDKSLDTLFEQAAAHRYPGGLSYRTLSGTQCGKHPDGFGVLARPFWEAPGPVPRSGPGKPSLHLLL